MNTTTKVMLYIGAVAAVVFSAGCATEKKMIAEFVVTPAEVKDIQAVDTLEIVPTLNLSGNAFAKGDYAPVAGALVQRMAARLSQEGFYRSVDIVWGNVNGAAAMGNLIDSKKSLHGHARFTTESDFPKACLSLEFNLKMDRVRAVETQSFTLTTNFYDVVTPQNGVPYGTPAGTETRQEKRNMNIFQLIGAGNVVVKLTDKTGNLVYEKEFSDLKFTDTFSEKELCKSELVKVFGKDNDDVRGSLVCNNAAVTKLLLPVIDEIIADISPHKIMVDLASGVFTRRKHKAGAETCFECESKLENGKCPKCDVAYPLLVNESGDEKAVLLLKALAYSEAIRRLDEVLGGEDNDAADYENRGLAYMLIGDYAAAISDFDAALALDSGSATATNGKIVMEKFTATRKKLRQMKAKDSAKKVGTQYKTPEQ